MAESEKEKIVAIIRALAENGVMATCDGDAPVVRCMTPIVEDDLAIWVTTTASTNKVKQIRRNPRVCLLLGDPPTHGEREVSVRGKAEIVPDLATRKRIWGLAPFNLFDHFPNGPESPDFCVLRILPEEIRWRESWAGGNKVYRPEE